LVADPTSAGGATPRSRVAVAEIEPQRAVRAEDAADFSQHFDEVGDVELG